VTVAVAQAATGEPALRVQSLVKRYGSRAALDGVSFALARGSFTALLGPNGAGKSTLFQLLTGLFAADGGDAAVDGLSLRTQAVAALRHIGVVFQQMSLDLDLSVRATCASTPTCMACRARWRASASKPTPRRAGLAADLDRPVRELSGGNRRKVELVRALLHRPACC
jgi:ABC-2 type transport system ATP-binding protein